MTDDFLTLTEFIPGTKAKAQEVNANFSTLKNALETKASSTGNSAQTFAVAQATEANHAVTKAQLDSLSEYIDDAIEKTGIKFCVHSGNTTSGEGDLFTVNGLTISTKTGTGYDALTALNYKGEQITLSTSKTLSMSGKPDGVYNIFLKSDGTLYAEKNILYKQKTRPALYSEDIWLDTSSIPLSCIKYNGTDDEEFKDIPIGKATITNSTITDIKTFPFNQNGYEVNIYTLPKYKYDYGHPIVKYSGATYTAEVNGLLYIRHANTNDSIGVTIEGFFYSLGWSSSQGSGSVAILPIAKGQSYIFSGGEARYFIPEIEA